MMNAARRFTFTALASVCALAGLLAFLGASAQATVTHDYLPELSEKLSAEVPAKGPHGEEIALPGLRLLEAAAVVDSGHLWVAEELPHEFVVDQRIDEYDLSTGEFLGQIPHTHSGGGGLAVGHSGGEVLLYTTGTVGGKLSVNVYTGAGALKGTWTGEGTPAGSFNAGNGALIVAVDNSTDPLDERKGDVYVADPEHQVVDVFHPEADGKEHYVGQLKGTSPTEPFTNPARVAVNEVNGDVVVKDAQKIDIFEPTLFNEYLLVHQITGTPFGPFGPDNESGVLATAVGSGDIYITDRIRREPTAPGELVIDQFSSAGAFLGQFGSASAPKEFGNVHSLAVDQESKVYVPSGGFGPSGEGWMYTFSADIVTPDVTSEAPSSVAPFTATLNGTVDPSNAGVATCWFEWGTTKVFGKTAPCEPEAVPNGGSQKVHATLSGLQSGTRYFYRLEAKNANGTNPGEASQDQEFTTQGPGFRDESVTDLAGTSVTFDGVIDPNGRPTTFYVEYGPTSGYGADAPTPPGEAIGEGEDEVELTPHHIQELLVGTVYHYRLVAVSEMKSGEFVTFDGPDQTFTTETAAVSELPDGRHWEMVSTPDKKGARILPLGFEGAMRAAANGQAISYQAFGPTEAEPQGNTTKMQVLSTRGPAGWTSKDLDLPHRGLAEFSIGLGTEYRFFSSDLSRAVVQPFGNFTPALSAEASESTAMLRTLGACTSSCFRPLVTGKPGYANVPPDTAFGDESEGRCLSSSPYCGPIFDGATEDLSHIVLSSPVPLEADAPAEGQYEWSGGKLTFIGVLPDGAVGGGLPVTGNSRGGISRDGSRVILEANGAKPGLYMRHVVLGSVASGKTVQLDAAEPACVAEGGCRSGRGHFQFASADGSKVFFTAPSTKVGGEPGPPHRLTKDAGTSGSDLYECEMVEKAGELECTLSDIAREALGVMGASEDGAYLYFVASSALAEGAAAGENNLYVRHDGTTKFIAALSNEDFQDWSERPEWLPARVSPDGNWAAFMSQRALTGYDNRDAISGRPDAEVYLYNASTGRLVCASCDPTGARPLGTAFETIAKGLAGSEGWGGKWVAATMPTSFDVAAYYSGYPPRDLSDSGRLFFNSSDALVPQDVDGTEDVYEYEPPGIGNCTTASTTFSEHSGGCVGLISAGTSAEESGFLEASEGGGDVFFLTSSRLSAQDYDNAIDVYDAHECTSAVPCFPAVVSPPPACTTAEACRAAQTPQPANFGAPSSATFSGAGNIAPGSGGVVVTAKSLKRAQQLANALRTCRKKPRKRRAGCERRARAQYGPVKLGKAAAMKGKR
jgi:hypothetical protein